MIIRLVPLRASALLLNPTQRGQVQPVTVRNNDESERRVTYRGVEEAFVVHRQVQLGLDALDGHHAEPHRDQVEHGCRNAHKHTESTHKRRRSHSEREILVNIIVPSAVMTPALCQRITSFTRSLRRSGLCIKPTLTCGLGG